MIRIAIATALAILTGLIISLVLANSVYAMFVRQGDTYRVFGRNFIWKKIGRLFRPKKQSGNDRECSGFS